MRSYFLFEMMDCLDFQAQEHTRRRPLLAVQLFLSFNKILFLDEPQIADAVFFFVDRMLQSSQCSPPGCFDEQKRIGFYGRDRV